MAYPGRYACVSGLIDPSSEQHRDDVTFFIFFQREREKGGGGGDAGIHATLSPPPSLPHTHTYFF